MLCSPSLPAFNLVGKPVFCSFFAEFDLRPRRLLDRATSSLCFASAGTKQKFLANKKKRSLWPTKGYRRAREVTRRVTVAASPSEPLSSRLALGFARHRSEREQEPGLINSAQVHTLRPRTRGRARDATRQARRRALERTPSSAPETRRRA